MGAKQLVLAAVFAGIILMLAPEKSLADEFYTFVETNCDQSANLFEIKEIGLYDEEGRALENQSRINDPPDKSGTYSLGDLLTEVGEGEALVPTKTLRKTCKLSTGTFVAEIRASKGISARGECGATPPDVVLSLRKKSLSLIRNLEFGEFCSSFSPKNIISVVVRGADKKIIISATSGSIPIKRIFSTQKRSLIVRDTIFSDAYSADAGTNIWLALEKGDLKTVRALLDKGTDIESQNVRGESILTQAIAAGETQIIEELVNRGADVNQKSFSSGTPLMTAGWSGSVDVIKLLFEKGADLNASDGDGATALMRAVCNTATVDLLLSKGAEVDLRDKLGLTALIRAAMAGYAASVGILLDAGADVSAEDNRGMTALAWALAAGNSGYVPCGSDQTSDRLKTVKVLKQAGAKQ